jgi:hypothetical protein
MHPLMLSKKNSGIPPGPRQTSRMKMTSQHKFFPPLTIAHTNSPDLPFLFMTRTLCARIWMRLVSPSVRTILIRNQIAPWLAQTGRARRNERRQMAFVIFWQSSPGQNARR